MSLHIKSAIIDWINKWITQDIYRQRYLQIEYTIRPGVKMLYNNVYCDTTDPITDYI